MDFDWTEQQRAFRDGVIRFARGELAQSDRSARWFAEAWRKCATFGIQGIPVAEEYGGTGADMLTTIAALEALGYACADNGLIFSLNAQMWACQYPIERFGTEEQRRAYLPRLCDGTLIAAHAMSEPGSGSDAFALSTTVVTDGDGFRLSGSKTFVTNAPVAGLFVVLRASSKDDRILRAHRVSRRAGGPRRRCRTAFREDGPAFLRDG